MNDRAWVATRKGLFELRIQAGRWQVHKVSFLGEPVTQLLPPSSTQPGGFMLAALNLGHFGVKVHASPDAGATWHEVATPTYPPQPESLVGPEWKLVQVWALERSAGFGERAGQSIVWAGTMPGGLFCSADQGRSWQLVQSLWNHEKRTGWMGGGNPAPGMHSVCPHPHLPGQMLLGISCGGAWVTDDAGASWRLSATGMLADYMPPEMADDENTQDPHRILRCEAAPEHLWCQHHGGIYKSSNGGALWERIHAPISSFGFALAVHPQAPGTAWFVPAVKDETRVPVGGVLVVNRTQDGGESFETFRAGLPQRDCYDLIYRHGLDVADDGKTLLMGSTTGNLWASGDAGESWALVNAHLPPIAAVRFG